MAHLAYLKLGDIKGSAIIKAEDRNEHIPVLSFSHRAAAQYDVLGRLDMKDRRHNPVVFTKHVDFCTPLIRQAHANMVPFATATFNFFHMPRSGPEKHYYTLKFSTVGIVSYKMIMPSALDPLFASTHEYEEITLTYKSVEYSHTGPTMQTLEAGQYSGTTSEEKDVKIARFWYDEFNKLALSKTTDMAVDEVKSRAEKILRQAKGEEEPPK
jgi:type VI secretion system Hcp family effector